MSLSPKVSEYVRGAEECGISIEWSEDGAQIVLVNATQGRRFVREIFEIEHLRAPYTRGRLDAAIVLAKTPIASTRRKPSKTGPAWDALVSSVRGDEHGAQVFVDAYEAGLRDAAQRLRDAAAFSVRYPLNRDGLIDLSREIEP